MKSHWEARGGIREILEASSRQNGECIETTVRNDSRGYGRIMFQGKRTMAHRLSYELAYGPIPDGLVIRHKCDNPPCINPEHLEVGTHRDNMDDRINRMSGRRGHDIHTSKLTAEGVQEVRRRVSEGESRRSVARSFDISHTAVNHIIKGKNWRHLREDAA